MSRAPDFDQDSLAGILMAMLPRGPIWRRTAPVLSSVFLGLAALPAAFHARARNFLEVEAFPPSAVELLGDWESALGLPDECVGAGGTTVERQLSVSQRMTEQGGQSPAYYVAVAAALGYAVTIEECRPFRVGISSCADPIRGEAWAHAWIVRAPAVTVTEFQVGISSCADPLRSWGNERLECALSRIKPAHTVLIFAYGD